MTTNIRIAAHGLLFLLAFVVFYLGLGLGLAWNPLVDSLLWLAAGSIVAMNIVWILRSRQGPDSREEGRRLYSQARDREGRSPEIEA